MVYTRESTLLGENIWKIYRFCVYLQRQSDSDIAIGPNGLRLAYRNNFELITVF